LLRVGRYDATRLLGKDVIDVASSLEHKSSGFLIEKKKATQRAYEQTESPLPLNSTVQQADFSAYRQLKEN
jgi:hypothetical protein